MHATITLDERHQEEPTVAEPTQTSQTKVSTALASLEEPVIDGEVTAIIEPLPPPTPKQRPYYLIPALTLSQSTTVPATGKRHLDATKAEGTITFYNGLFVSQTIAAGTILTSADGVEIIIDQAAIIPAGNPPIYGQVTVSAHALNAGVQGNIEAFDVNQACCLTSVLAKNTQEFTGGAESRDYLVVTKEDIDLAAVPITTILEKSEQAALHAQINPGEALINPSCRKQTISDHTVGDEATEVHIIVSETCEGFAYIVGELRQNAQQMITKEAFRRLGTGFRLMGGLQVRILHTTVTDPAQGIVTIAVRTDATYVYQLSLGERKRITHLIAGKSTQQAVKALFQLPGIQGASINSNGSMLPNDPGSITIVVLYRSASL